MSRSAYDQWASIYDAVYSYVRDDIPFYVKEALDSGGDVLELGCGTGRVTIPIAQAGVNIVGLDFSEAMLDIARSKAEGLPGNSGELSLQLGDMRDFDLGRQFSLIIIPFRGFLSLLSVEDEISTLREIRRHLLPDGRLVFNIFVPEISSLLQEGDVAYHLRDVTDPVTGSTMVLWNQSRYDNFTQIVYARIIIEELDSQSEITRKLYRDFQLRYVHRWEMQHLLELCGFEILDLHGGFDRSPFDESSTEMVWVVRSYGD
ncbi:MAG: class I SAM-dependent methyltransferase [Chloroflexi bacterium]|nr:class I SAM-dependent methyltransferase [Chloroflexota bacterium]MCH7652936.1 class I SAM-dependent methyltransferase [Chloroflexota bacterium]